MQKLILLIITVCTTFTVWAQSDGNNPQSKIETKTIRSSVLDADREYTIFLPKSYEVETEKRYPVLYLFHGMLGTNKDWSERGHLKDVMDQLVASGEACEMIIVSPNAGGNIYKGLWNGYFDMPGWKYETFFYAEFLPHIESSYRVIGDKEHRAIAGLSMGGGGATSYAQRYPDMFCSAYAMSALMDLPEETSDSSNKPGEKMAFLGKSVIENSCVKFVQNANDKQKEQLRTVSWFVDCGDDDFLFDCNIDFYKAMLQAQIPCQLRVRDGGHTWEYWHSALYACLPFVSRNFSKPCFK